VILDPGLSGTLDLSTFTGDDVNARCFQAKIILGGLKETGDLPRWEAYRFYVMSP
jgi:hypothetical protein